MVPSQHELKSRHQVVNLDRYQVVNLNRFRVVNLNRRQVVSLIRCVVVNLTEFSTVIGELVFVFSGIVKIFISFGLRPVPSNF